MTNGLEGSREEAGGQLGVQARGDGHLDSGTRRRRGELTEVEEQSQDVPVPRPGYLICGAPFQKADVSTVIKALK